MKGTIKEYDFLLWKNILECDDLENQIGNSRNNNDILFKDMNRINLQNDVPFRIAPREAVGEKHSRFIFTKG
jgi:hypothetical protein